MQKTNSVTTSTLISGGATKLYGYSFKAASDSEVVLRDGDDTTGTGVVFVLLGMNQSIRDIFESGVPFEQGLYVDVVSGSVVGTVWT